MKTHRDCLRAQELFPAGAGIQLLRSGEKRGLSLPSKVLLLPALVLAEQDDLCGTEDL